MGTSLVEVLTSVADGHVTLAPLVPLDADAPTDGSAGAPDGGVAATAVDACRSLTRIGIGGEVRCRGTSVPPALQKLGVGNALRLELAAAYDEASERASERRRERSQGPLRPSGQAARS